MTAVTKRARLVCYIGLLVITATIIDQTYSFPQKHRIRRETQPSNSVPRHRTVYDGGRIPSNYFRRSAPSSLFSLSDDTLDDDWNPKEREQSQMPDYIASFLDKTKSDEEKSAVPVQDRYTHCIAIPMDECHELLLELESVQRAVLYHCPVLVHSCIVPAMTRLPLLYVEASGKTSMTATKTLHEIVERVIRKRFYTEQDTLDEGEEQESVEGISDIDDGDEDDVAGVNAQGYRPLVLSFHNLEIDGQGNQVLNTVATEDVGKTTLVAMVNELRSEIEAIGWKTAFPPDDQVDKTPDETITATDSSTVFRPRVPFMRLPEDFQSLLEPLPEDQEEWTRTSDQGGNGISPIFWHQWWEDSMARNVRLREVGVYPRQSGRGGLSEQAFYLPHETTPLPNGNDALTSEEDRHRSYHDKRMAEAEGRPVADEADVIPDSDIERQLEKLETHYAKNEIVESEVIEQAVAADTVSFDDIKDEIEESLKAMDDMPAMSADITRLESTPDVDHEELTQEQLDSWTKERIRKTVEARASVQARQVKLKDKPSIAENSIFQKYRDRTLVEKKKSTEPSIPKPELPPYPCREHFFGIWRVTSSPTGLPEEIGDDTKSDNLILRVDGTTMGGPILDQKLRQKASGGTWKMLDATDDDGTRLRIRLVLPPKKERILVMEGEVTRFLSPSEMPMTSSTFGIPQLEELASKKDGDGEDFMHCGGPVWIEDTVTGKNRQEIGTFSLMKIQSPMGDPSKYTVTIPKPVRSQD